MRSSKFAGFTFVELMLAASIFAVVAVAIYSTFGSGLSAWKKAQEAQYLYQDIRLCLEQMAQDLENATFYYDQKAEEPNFVGEHNRVSCYSLPGLKKITYSLADSNLQRLAQGFAESFKEEKEQEPELLATKISKLNFFYCYDDKTQDPPYKWKSTWVSKENKIPQGVKIELELGEEEKLVFSKYVFIPCGEKGKDEQE